MTRHTLSVALVALFFLAAFLLRPALLRWRTGRWGVHGVSGRPGSPGWWGGVLFVAALAATPVALGSPALPTPEALGVVGVLLASAGFALTVLAQAGMGASWRIGVPRAGATALVTDGLFAQVRNPVFAGMLLFAAGLLLLWPNPASLLAWVTLLAAVELQVRFVEEPWLREVHGEAWRSWASRVGRFLPGVGRAR